MNPDPLSLGIIVILLIFSAFFSSSETSLFAIDDIRLKNSFRGPKGRGVRQLLRQSSLLLIVILLGNTAVNVALSSLLEQSLNFQNMILTTIVATLIILVVGEITPKTIAMNRIEGVARFNSRLLKPFFFIFKPIARPIEIFSSLILKLLNHFHSENTELDEKHLSALASIVSRDNFLNEDEKKLIESVLQFASREVWNIMTPRRKVMSIEKNQSISDVIAMIRKTRFSKIPVFDKTDDNIIGVIYLRSIFPFIHHPEKISTLTLEDMIEPMYFVPENKKLSEMLEDFQSKKFRLAAVVDEYGSAVGIVSRADVLGEIMGEMMDESFDIRKSILKISKTRWLVKGDISWVDFNDYFKTDLKSENFETIAGLFIERTGDLPETGDQLDTNHYTITVKERFENHIEKFLVEKK